MNLPLKEFEGMPIVGRFWIQGQWAEATVYLRRFSINYCRFCQMFEVITERDGMEEVADDFFLEVLHGLN